MVDGSQKRLGINSYLTQRMQTCGSSLSRALFEDMQPSYEEFDFEFDSNQTIKYEMMPVASSAVMGGTTTTSRRFLHSPWHGEQSVAKSNSYTSNIYNKIEKQGDTPVHSSIACSTIRHHHQQQTHYKGYLPMGPLNHQTVQQKYVEKDYLHHELDHKFGPATLEWLGSLVKNRGGAGGCSEGSSSFLSLSSPAVVLPPACSPHHQGDHQPLLLHDATRNSSDNSRTLVGGETAGRGNTKSCLSRNMISSASPSSHAGFPNKKINIEGQDGCFFPSPVCSESMLEALFPLPATFRPGPYSVIIGRGGSSANKCAIGNRRLRVIASTFLERYSKASTKGRKSIIVSTIVNIVKEACPMGGAFVRMGKDGRWYEAEAAASEKVGYTLREMLGDKYKSSSKSKGRKRQGRYCCHRAASSTCASSSSISSSEGEDAGKEGGDEGHQHHEKKKNKNIAA